MTSDKPKHDEIFRKSMENPIVAKEFLVTHLPKDVLALIDSTSLKLEKDSFIEPDLSETISDVLFSVKFNDQDGYIFLLLEHQSTVDKMMAFRLFKYMINICDRYLTTNPKAKRLPVIYPLIIYNGKKKYNAPLNIWNLFSHPDLAIGFWTNDCQLINVHDIPDEELKKKVWSGILLFFLKHIHERQLLKRWQEISHLLPKLSKITIGHDHIRNLLSYTLTFIEQNDKIELEKILKNSLTKEKGEELMPSIAQVWKEEGIQIGLQDGIKIGEARGEAKGRAEGRVEAMKVIAKTMLLKHNTINEIIELTGLSKKQIERLK
ncbi:Rpn family recombination-promoting nuclease/putative transposase [Rickettsia endosymbiont of Culicoides newsteadi]|uniref:Rpn family recombination-promoting nuclease/putative transposase n=1 Tax=Rickettsia endosymbiont of Culicoides newsteadi TaxID=1961830 RepID=UPI000B9A7D78|nr:Rpn family recombination-promoting nuclease/putative transposase [Rickettsia endosymbiont of Culicoides newsteadi]OZG32210.1 transposase [Rickettsia endosymbiont of Culicoides newsteadi]